MSLNIQKKNEAGELERVVIAGRGKDAEVVDSLESKETTKALSANMGRELYEKIKSLKNSFANVYFDSDDLLSLQSKADGEAFAKCHINVNGSVYECNATLKVQGNASASFPKKNYTVKFIDDNNKKIKIDVGWGPQSKYCFKANWIDTTQARNIVGANIAEDMVRSRPDSEFKENLLTSPCCGQVDGFPINVYVNGAFHGIYTWNIPKDAWTFNMDSENEEHVVIASEFHTDCTAFKTHWTNDNITDWSVQVGPTSDGDEAPTQATMDAFNRLVDFLNTSNENIKENYKDYFDLYSVIDYYCYCAMAYHPDGITKNMLLVSYDGGAHWGATLYDMDATFCLHWNGGSFYDIESYSVEISTSSRLFNVIREVFKDELIARYEELRKTALSYASIIDHADNIAENINKDKLEKEFAKWDTPQQDTNTIDKFKDIVYQRQAITDSRMELTRIDPVVEQKNNLECGSAVSFSEENCPIYNPDTDWSIFLDFTMNEYSGAEYIHVFTARGKQYSVENSNCVWIFVTKNSKNILRFNNLPIVYDFDVNKRTRILITHSEEKKVTNVYCNGWKAAFPYEVKYTYTDSDFETGVEFKAILNSNSSVGWPTNVTYHDFRMTETFIDNQEAIRKIMRNGNTNPALKNIRNFRGGTQVAIGGASRSMKMYYTKEPFFADGEMTVEGYTGEDFITATEKNEGCIEFSCPGGKYGNKTAVVKCGKMTRNLVCSFVQDVQSSSVQVDCAYGAPPVIVPGEKQLLANDFTVFMDFSIAEGTKTAYPDVINMRYADSSNEPCIFWMSTDKMVRLSNPSISLFKADYNQRRKFVFRKKGSHYTIIDDEGKRFDWDKELTSASNEAPLRFLTYTGDFVSNGGIIYSYSVVYGAKSIGAIYYDLGILDKFDGIDD